MISRKASSFLILAAYILFSAQGCGIIESLGRNPEGEQLSKIEQLPNYKDGKFHNVDGEDSVKMNGFKALNSMLNRRESVRPFHPVPFIKTDLRKLSAATPTVVWFGHSSLLIKSVQGTILIDPIFSKSAGPIAGMVKAFGGSTSYSVDDMPDIDILLISHDHYDHLDYRTVKKLKDRVKKVIVPISVNSHLLRWGFRPEQITELNWNQSADLPGGIKITATPAHHRSNRTLKTDKTLWASYVINTDGYKLFYSGDGGYGSHFKQIGQQYGPFDLALMECGQYSPNWPTHHMHPEQTAQAAFDLKAKMIQPVHWGKFAESNHPWNESVNLLLPAAKKLNIEVSIPLIGQPYSIGQPAKTTVWWAFE